MTKPTFSLAEHAIEKLTKCTDSISVERLKLIRLQHHISLRLEHSYSQILKPLGLNQSEWFTLLFLYSSETKKFFPSELAKALNCSRTNATRLIESLKKRNFIHCAVNSVDRRKMQISLNQEGRNFVDQYLPGQLDNLNSTIDNIFTKKEEETYFNLGMKMLRYLERNG